MKAHLAFSFSISLLDQNHYIIRKSQVLCNAGFYILLQTIVFSNMLKTYSRRAFLNNFYTGHFLDSYFKIK